MHKKYIILLRMGYHSGKKRNNWNYFTIKVHYNLASPLKNIDLKDAASLNGVTVTMYTSKEHAIKVLLPNGSSLVFSDFNDRFYTLNMNEINKDVMAHSCLQTVNQNKTHFTRRKVVESEKSRFYNSKLDGEVTLLSNPSFPIIL